MLHLITIGFVVARSPTDLHCGAGRAQASPPLPNLTVPVDPAWLPLPLGTIAPRGWLLEQLLLQANALSGFIPTSTFPGALTVNQSAWTGSTTSFSGTSQWLPYWSNGNVPLLLLLRAAGPAALARLDPSAKLEAVIDGMMTYVLSHTNRSGHGWIGPYLNEPGDVNGHGLWDPLNMLRSLMMYAEATPRVRRAVAAAVVAHLTSEAALLVSDPVYKWASTRWPTFVQVCLYVVDHYVAEFGADRAVMPLGGRRTAEMLMDAARRFRAKGMDWLAYYNRTGPVKFPTRGSVSGWNTHDHGVNNAEGALAWPAIDQRLGAADAPAKMALVLHMLDTYQGQPNALFCADEVFCGRAPHRGTETCAVVEAMASLEQAFAVLGEPNLADRTESLAFNALPAALTSDMWTHVYVQQANSVFAGDTKPKVTDAKSDGADGGGGAAALAFDPSLRHHHLHSRHQPAEYPPEQRRATHTEESDGKRAGHVHTAKAAASCPYAVRDGGSSDDEAMGNEGRLGAGCAFSRRHLQHDTPSGEDQGSNFYGVSHFPCCITNFPQGETGPARPLSPTFCPVRFLLHP